MIYGPTSASVKPQNQWHDTAGDSELSSFSNLSFQKTEGKKQTFTIPKSACFCDFHSRKEKIDTLPVIFLRDQ